ncbi:MAG TPA: GDSL-type esterase/lipase family protein [Planctomycetota bacterium]|nr:GDSL-type esterase/lipase family protein [Planctomycetota bacterium]
MRKMTIPGILAVVFAATPAFAQELRLSACDTTSSFSAGGGASVSVNTGDKMQGDASFQVTLAQTPTNAPYVRIGAAAAWSSYSGIRFWVKRVSGSEQGASLQLLWTRHYAGFPLTSSWTEVTLRWQDFTQRLYAGTCENLLGSVDTIEFTLAPGETHDGGSRGPLTFLVDDIRLVPGLSPLPTTLPSAAGFPITKARLEVGQPVKIVCLGTSITYGHVNGGGRVSTPWPAALQTKLRSDLGTTAITVMNYGVRGSKSWQGAAAIQDFVFREQPQMVLIEYLANDYVDAEPANGVTEYRNNMERLFDLLLRWGQADVGVVLPNPYGQSGNTHVYDTYVAHLTAAANSRHLFVVDVYHAFLALPEATLLSYYLEPAVDHAHLNNDGCLFWAQKAGDAIVADLKSSPPPPPAAAPPAQTKGGGGGGGGGCGATGLEALLAVLLLRRVTRYGPSTR